MLGLSTNKGRLAYVIARARGQLDINVTCIFKVFTKLPESRLSYQGQNSVKRATFKVSLPSRKQVCRLPLKNRLAVAREKSAITNGKQNTAITLQKKL